MKKLLIVSIAVIMVLMLVGCGKTKEEPQVTINPAEDTENSIPEVIPTEEPSEDITENEITADMAFEGVANYCSQTYNWSPELSSMYVALGEETETEYQIIFRSYTGAFVHFYVDKITGVTRIADVSPIDNTENETGTINISDYLD